MSSAIDVAHAGAEKMPPNWSLWLRQIRAIFRLEIEKNFLSRRSILIYLIALLPLFPLALQHHLLDHLQRFDSSHARLFWIGMDLHESVPR